MDNHQHTPLENLLSIEERFKLLSLNASSFEKFIPIVYRFELMTEKTLERGFIRHFILPKTVENEPIKCCICLLDMEIGEMSGQIPCKHVFHSECITTWLTKNKHCPYCRMSVSKKLETFVSDFNNGYDKVFSILQDSIHIPVSTLDQIVKDQIAQHEVVDDLISRLWVEIPKFKTD